MPDIGTQTNAMVRFNATTRHIANSTGTTLIDLDQELPKSVEFMYDDVHYTVAGAQQVAQIIARAPVWEILLAPSAMPLPSGDE